jgi:uncharacterized protein YdaU (DUF1376 family)
MADYPALPLWTDAYLADTTHLSATESGAYLHLLMAAWRAPTCSIPNNDRQLARMARCTPREWQKVRGVVMAFWTLDDATTFWTQKRLLTERIRVRENSREQSRKAGIKWLKEKETRNAAASSGHMPNVSPDDASIEEPNGSSSPLVPPNVDAAAKEPKPDGRKRPARPLPADWKPDQADHRAARERGLSYADIAVEATKFRDYCLAHDKRYVDFAAAWRNWCDSPYRKAGPPRVNGGGSAAETLAAHRERDRRGILAALAPELDNRGATAGDGDGGAGAGGDGADGF